MNQRSDSGTQKRVAIYVRVSTVEQAEEGYSIDEQLRLLKQYCDNNNYVIFKEYADRGISGKSIKGRPALQELLRDAEDRKFDVVFVWKLNRLARNILDLLKMVDMLQKNNIAFRSYSENFETETPAGKLSLHMMAAVGEFERGTIAQNVKMGMLARAREGRWNGGAVLGYDIIETPTAGKKRKETHLVVNEMEAATVRKIFELYVQGNGYKSIVNRLNQEGYKTKKGNMFAVATLKEIIKNPVYIGKIRYNVRRDWSEKRRRNINPNPVLVDGEHEPIIPIEMWERAQVLLEERSGKPSRVYDSEFPLTGLLRCPECGSGMVIGRTVNTRKDGSKRVLEYYVCGAWKNKGSAVCHSNGIRTDYADAYVFNKVAELVRNQNLLKDVLDKVNKSRTEDIGPANRELEVLQREAEKVQSRMSKYLALYEDDGIPRDELIQRMAQLKEEKRLIEERMTPLRIRASDGNSQPVSYELVREVLDNFYSILCNVATREQKKQLLHLLISKITIDESRKIDTIKIRINEGIITYLTKGEGLSLKSSPSPYLSFPELIPVLEIAI